MYFSPEKYGGISGVTPSTNKRRVERTFGKKELDKGRMSTDGTTGFKTDTDSDETNIDSYIPPSPNLN